MEQQDERGARRVEYISCKGGVAASSVAETFDITVVDCSCTASFLAAEPHVALHGGYAGRSPSATNEQVAKPRHFRAPGSADRACVDGRSVIRIYSRWGSGPASRSAHVQPPADAAYEVRTDNTKQRRAWYQHGLGAAHELLGHSKSVAFADNGSTTQRPAIQAFARQHPELRVAVVYDSSSMVASMRALAAQSHAAALAHRSKLAHRQAESFENPQLRAIAHAVCGGIDGALLTTPGEEISDILTASVADAGVAEHGAAPISAQREAAAQLCCEHLSKGSIAAAREAVTSAPQLVANNAQQGERISIGLDDWQGRKGDVRSTGVSQELKQQLRSSSCAWQWDSDTRRTGDYHWVEQITVAADGTVTRTGVEQGGRYVAPRAARMALSSARAAQYDTLHLAAMAVQRIEAAVERHRLEQEQIDQQYREYVRRAMDSGEFTARQMCDSLVGPQLASTLVATAVQTRLAAAESDIGQAYITSPTESGSDPEPGETKDVADGQQRERFRIDVSSSIAGRNTPLRLRGLKLATADGTDHSIDVEVTDGIPDSGSCACIAGLAWAEKYMRLAPSSVVRLDKPLPTSLGGVTGVGGGSSALYYIRVSLMHGDCELVLHDVPVLPNIPGLLIGNDAYGIGGATFQYWQQPRAAADGLPCDGELTLRNPRTGAVSTPLPFTHRITTQRVVAAAGASAFTAAADEQCDADDWETLVLKAERDVAFELNKHAVPIAYAPQALHVPKWSYRKLRVRVPATCVNHEVCVIPLADSRLNDLGLTVHSTLGKADADGYLDVMVTNTTSAGKDIGLLQAVGRFVVDPTAEDMDIEFTTDEIMDLINIDPGVSDSDRLLIRDMVAAHRRLFATALGYAHGYKMSIKTPLIDANKAQPPNIPNRPRSREETQALKEAVDKQLKAGLIMPCRSPYNAQPVLIRKADWTPEKPSYRVTLDFRAVNSLCERDAYPLPSVATHLDSLGKANLYTTADLLMGFHQCELNEDDGSHLKTAFGTPWGQYCYRRMPMGLTSSPGCFMRLVDSAFRGLPAGLVLAYCDDIIVPTCGDMRAHMQDVAQVFSRLIEAGFTVRCDKVHIGKAEVPYLGFLAGAKGNRPNPEKTRALLDMAVEQLVKEPTAIGRFAGMIGVYAKYIPNCHILLAPFHDLKQKGADFAHAESLRMRTGFAALVRQLADATALARPDYSKPFYLDADSSVTNGVGLVLTQREDEKDPESHRPLAFGSHKFTDAEKAFPIRDMECYGIYTGLKLWRHILMGARVIVRTDHKSLQWLMRNRHPDGSRVAGWAMKLQEFDLEITWVPGRDHIAADCISRAVAEQQEGEEKRGEDGGHLDGEDAATEQRLDHLEAVTLMAGESAEPVARQRHESAQRVALAAVENTGATVRVLVERHDDVYALPSATVQSRTATKRQQLLRAIEASYGPTSEVARRLALRASAHKRQRKAQSGTHLFMMAIDGTVDLPAGTGLVEVSAELADLMASDDDKLLIRHLVDGRPQNWQGVRSALQRMRSQTLVASTQESRPVATIQERPYGPALCASNEDVETAVTRLTERLRKHEGASLAVDLEGDLVGRYPHIALMQVCVDAVEEGEEQLAYVFDVHRNRRILNARGATSIASLLEDGSIPKVLHGCGGDASSLYYGHGIKLNHFLDTGLADLLLRRYQPGSMRNLEALLKSKLGEKVQMTHKGSFEFTPGLFESRPLSELLFTYAYEDVTLLNELYRRLLGELREDHLEELAFALSQQRSPASRLVVGHVASLLPATKVAIALMDSKSVTCLQGRAGGVCSLPWAHVSDVSASAQTVKQVAQLVWRAQMGPPPKGVAAAVNARTRKPVQIGDTLLFTAAVPDCTTVLTALSTVFAGTIGSLEHDVVVRAASSFQETASVAASQIAVFQYLRVELERRSHRHGQTQVQAAHSVGSEEAEEKPTFKVHLHLAVRADQTVAAGTSLALQSTALWGEANIVTGPAVTGMRGAIILHDGELVFTINGSSWSAELCFPSMQVEVGCTAREAAVRGFDILAGSALRKGGSDDSQRVYESHALSPLLGRMLTTQFEDMPSLGTWGNTEYFACALQPGTLRNFASAFYMARQATNGFRVTPTLQKRHVGFQLCRVATALERLQKFDAAAMAAALSNNDGGATMQRTGTTLVALLLNDMEMATPHDPETSTTGGVSQHSEVAAAECIQRAARRRMRRTEEADFDALFTAHALLTWYAHSSAAVGESQHSEQVYAAEAAGGGSEPRPAPIKREEILEAQQAHPGTAQFIDHLRMGDIDDRWAGDTSSARADFLREVEQHELAHDGLLLRRAPEGPPRIVVPPQMQERVLQQCHDHMGHFGIKRCLQVLTSRFYWGTVRQMRKQLSEHIRYCDACQRTNIHRHKAGEQVVAEHGEGPAHTWLMDGYKVGWESDGYDSTLNFMCAFSHLVVAEPTTVHMTSEEVCGILLKSIICVYGTPSCIRCDNASVFVSKVTQAMADTYGISLKTTTAYNHSAIGALERFHSVLKKLTMAERIASGSERWHAHLPLLVWCYNATVGATGYAPFHVMFGRPPPLPVDTLSRTPRRLPQELPDYIKDMLEQLGVVWDAVGQALLRNSLHSIKKLDLRYDVNEQFRAGDLVLLRKGSVVDNLSTHPKAVEVNDGPFVVDSVLGRGNVKLTNMGNRRIKEVVNTKRLTRYYRRPTPTAAEEESKPRLDRLWAVQGIVGHRITTAQDTQLGVPAGQRDIEYRVRFVRFDKGYDKWLRAPYLTTVWELVAAYQKHNDVGEFAPPTLELDTREHTGTHQVSAQAQSRPHFRPTDPERRQQQRAVAEPTAADGASQAVTQQTRDEELQIHESDAGPAVSAETTGAQSATAPEPATMVGGAAARSVNDKTEMMTTDEAGSADDRGTARTEERPIQDDDAGPAMGVAATGAQPAAAPEPVVTKGGAAAQDMIDETEEMTPAEASATYDREAARTHASAAEQRLTAREERRAAWLRAEAERKEQRRRQREEKVKRLEAQNITQALIAAAADGEQTAQSGVVQLIADDGSPFQVDRAAAVLSGTVKAILQGQCIVEGNDVSTIKFAELDRTQLLWAVRYMNFKHDRQTRNTQRAFDIPRGLELRLFRTANYLDL